MSISSAGGDLAPQVCKWPPNAIQELRQSFSSVCAPDLLHDIVYSSLLLGSFDGCDDSVTNTVLIGHPRRNFGQRLRATCDTFPFCQAPDSLVDSFAKPRTFLANDRNVQSHSLDNRYAVSKGHNARRDGEKLGFLLGS